MAVDIRAACPLDVKNMLLKQVRKGLLEDGQPSTDVRSGKKGVVAGPNPGFVATRDQRSVDKTWHCNGPWLHRSFVGRVDQGAVGH